MIIFFTVELISFAMRVVSSARFYKNENSDPIYMLQLDTMDKNS